MAQNKVGKVTGFHLPYKRFRPFPMANRESVEIGIPIINDQ